MLWTTALHISECANVAVAEMPIEMLRQIGPDYEVWLRQRPYSPKSRSTFLYCLRRLIEKADELDAGDAGRALRDAWQPISEALEKVRQAPQSLPMFAISRAKSPADFTDADLTAWGEWMVRRGRKYHTVRVVKSLFRQAIRRAGLQHLLPAFRCEPAVTAYGIRASQMPEPLRTQVAELLRWKQAKYAKGRPQKARHRPVSAKLLEHCIGRLYGFAINVAGRKDITSLPGLFTEELVGGYIEWAINDRNVSRSAILRLSMLYGAMRYHPDYRDQDYGWFSELCCGLPEDDAVGRAARKAKKKVAYDVIRTVPRLIHESRLKGCSDAKQRAWAAHDELLIAWITTLPWRQRNIRECRIGDAATSNIFFAALPGPGSVHIARPDWVQKALIADSQQRFWQFYFRKEETKTGHEVRGILPRRLIPMLEEYITQQRPLLLVSGHDPGTLFLNREGISLDRQTMTELVAELTLKHTGVRVTPHIFRDIFAAAWLEAHPEDFLTLSKILWHQNVQYTVRVYGSDYDESNGARAVDQWLGL